MKKIIEKCTSLLIAAALTVSPYLPANVSYAAKEIAEKTYQVEIEDLEHGSIVTEESTYPEGTKVTLKEKPEKGYDLSSITVKNPKGKGIKAAKQKKKVQEETEKQTQTVKRSVQNAEAPATESRAASDDVDYAAIKGDGASDLFYGGTQIQSGLMIPDGYTGFMRRTAGLAPTLSFSCDSTYTNDAGKVYPSITLKAAYKDGRISAVYPRSCYYDGTWVDVKVTALDWKKDGSDSINMFFMAERPGIMVDNCAWIELQYEFFRTGTHTPIRVKGYSTWKDIDFDQGVVLKDGFLKTKESVYAVSKAKNNLAFVSLNGNPYYFDHHFSNATDNMPDYMITALYDAAMLKTVYTFVRHNSKSIGRGGISNESDKLIPGPVSLQKRVSDNDERMVLEDTLNQEQEPRKEHFTYTLTATTAGETANTYYGHYQIWDSIDPGLMMNMSGITITDENGTDVKSWFDISEAGNKLLISAKATVLQSAGFYAKVYNVNIPVSIRDSINLSDENIYFVREKGMARIRNQASLSCNAGNVQSDPVTTWIPLVTIKKGTLTIEKKEEGTGTALNGVTFQVYEWNGSAYNAEAYDTLDDGYIKGTYQNTKDYIYTTSNQGKFKVVETQSAPLHFNSGWSKEIQYDGTAAQALTYEVTNPKMEPKLCVAKRFDHTTGAKLVEGRYQDMKMPGWYDFGETATATLTVSNPGNVEVTGLVVTEEMSDALKAAIREDSAAYVIPKEIKTQAGKKVQVTVDPEDPGKLHIDRLEAGDSLQVDFSAVLTEHSVERLTDLQNVVRVTGSYQDSTGTAAVPEDEDDTDIDLLHIYNPKVGITKYAGKAETQNPDQNEPESEADYQVEKGGYWFFYDEDIPYEIKVSNEGNTPLYDLKITDTMSTELKAAVLAEKAEFKVAERAQTELGKTVQIKKGSNTSVTLDVLEPGDSVRLQFLVRVSDRETVKKLAALTGLRNSVRVDASYGDRENPTSLPPKEDQDTVSIYNPLMSIIKTADKTTISDTGEKVPGWYFYEELVTYDLIIKNYGNVDLSEIHVTDRMSPELEAAIQSGQASFATGVEETTAQGALVRLTRVSARERILDHLAAGDQVTVKFQAVLSPRERVKDLTLLENLDNQAGITATFERDGKREAVPEDEDDRDEDKISIYNPLMRVTKQADRTRKQKNGRRMTGKYTFSDTITYEILVENYGNTDIRNLQVEDTMSKELKALVREGKASFGMAGSVQTVKGKNAAVKTEKNLTARLALLEAGDSVLLKVTAKIRDAEGIQETAKRKGVKNMVRITGDYGKGLPVPEDEDDKDLDAVDLSAGWVKLYKTSSGDGKALKGAVFEIFTEEGEKQAVLTTDSAGHAKSRMFAPGSYYVVEKTAPAGYRKDDTKRSFTVKDGETAVLKLKNDPEGAAANTASNPKTGDTSQPLLFVGLFLIAGAVLAVVVKKKKKK